jgi:PIN domain nuclease of toxin-antitoxin system
VKLLFDTPAFIWWDNQPARLSPVARAACEDPANDLFFSVASAWEMQIKYQLGKLKLHRPLPEIITDQRQTNGIQILPVTLDHVFALEQLPNHHKDPFDRLLIAQANLERASLVSDDSVVASYPVSIVW